MTEQFLLVFIQFCVSSVFCSPNPDCYLSQAGHSHQFLVHFYFSVVDCQLSGLLVGWEDLRCNTFTSEVHQGVGDFFKIDF